MLANIIVRLHEIIDQTKYSQKVCFTIVESAKLAWNNRISLRGYLARIYLGCRHFLSCAFGIDVRQMYTHPPPFHSYFKMEKIYPCAVYYLHIGILFAHGDICICRFELYRQITRVKGK